MTRLEVAPAAAWADRVADELVARLAARSSLRLCLPTGDTPSPVYARLVERSKAGEVSFAAATVVGLDEFLGLPAGDPARCADRLRRELLDGLRPPPAAVHVVDGDASDPVAEAARLDGAAAGLDLVVLGLGMNGHVGLNEPGSGADAATRVVDVAETTRAAAIERYGAGRAPTRGITLGMDRILAAGEVWLLVRGASKRGVLARMLDEPEDVDCPATFLRRHARLWVIADEAAAPGRG